MNERKPRVSLHSPNEALAVENRSANHNWYLKWETNGKKEILVFGRFYIKTGPTNMSSHMVKQVGNKPTV